MTLAGVVEHHINTCGSRPIKQHVRREPSQLTEEADQTIDDMLARDFIKPSNSAWSSPIVILNEEISLNALKLANQKLHIPRKIT